VPDDALGDALRWLIRERFLPLDPTREFGDPDDLIALGVLDSLAFVELVEEIQARYGITVRDDEIVDTNFGSIVAIVDYIKRRRLM
jgi:acyl carrier protein